MPSNTADLDALTTECDELSEQSEAKLQESSDLSDQAGEVGWEGEGDESEKATRLYAKSWAAYSEYMKLRVELNEKYKEYDEATGVLTDETSALYEEIEELHSQLADISEAGEELCNKIAPLYTQDDAEDEIDGLWEEHDEKEKELDTLFEQLMAKEQELEEKTPEPDEEDEEE